MLYRGGMRVGIALAFLVIVGWAQAPAKLPQSELDSFEKVWTTIRNSHWEAKPGGLDWDAIHAEFRPRVERAATPEQARAITQEMLARLQQTHFGIVPAAVYSAAYEAPDSTTTSSGVTGIDLRVLDGDAVVTSVDPGSPAEYAGVRPGWIIASIGGISIKPLIKAAQSGPSNKSSNLQELYLTRSLLARLTEPSANGRETIFIDGSGKSIPLKLELAKPRGQLATLGNLPASPVWFEDRALKTSGEAFVEYLHFNEFLDIPRLMPAFQKSVQACLPKASTACHGLIIDLRGNPGGIGAMAMGMAGFLVDQPNQKLGTMYMRDATLNFVVNPRADVYTGPVAILIDATSASTSEIFAGGLQDLHRARVFGAHSAAAALPSVFERLPNGDGFQYAVANYISQGGKPLEGLGVTPDEEVRLTRKGLLAGHDDVIDAAIRWIETTQAAAPAKRTAK
ncbi:MAG: S41 family peptidase [Acidobacteriota bacterium]